MSLTSFIPRETLRLIVDQFPSVSPEGNINVNPEWPLVMRETY